MGHASVEKLSWVFLRQLYAKGRVSIGKVADRCVAKGITPCASEGKYSKRYIICLGLEDVVIYLLNKHQFSPRSDATPRYGILRTVIEPCDMSEEQKRIFNEWRASDTDHWDDGDDGASGEYGILDSIQFRFAPGWRKRYPDIPILEQVTH